MTATDENRAISTLLPGVTKWIVVTVAGILIVGGVSWMTRLYGQVQDVAVEVRTKASKDDLTAVREDLIVLKTKAKATEEKIDEMRAMLREIRAEARENARDAKAKK